MGQQENRGPPMVFFETILTIATEKVGEKLLTGISARFNPSDLETFLKQAIKAANESQSGGLFYAFQEDGLLGYGPFLNRFFKGRALAELKKPLEDNQGYLDVTFLTEALWQEAQGHSKLKKLDKDSIQPWMQVFVETYFQATNRALQFQVIKDDYCNQIRRVFDDVKFAGIAVEGQDIDRAERLADIFVIPDVEEDDSKIQHIPDDIPPAATNDPQQRLLWEQRQQILQAKTRSDGRKFSAANLFAEGRTNRAVLLGVPGSGKTTLMNCFAVVGTLHNVETSEQQTTESNALRGKLYLPPSICLPIIIRIRDLARHPDLSILEFVQEFAQKDLVVTRNLTGFFEYYLEQGNALILLDGLDEVADVAQRYKVVEKIEAFLNQFEYCPAIITSRPAGYKRDFFRTDEYPHYELQLFDDKKIDTFIEHWYNSRFELESERERRKNSLRKALQDQPRIQQLARNPLLLTIIALIHRYQAKLPKERYKLYDKAVETLLTTWDSQKELSNHEVLEYLELDDLRRLMERLAYWIHCQGGTGDTEGGTLIDRDELISHLTQYIREMKQIERHQAKAEAKRFLEQIVRERAGLLSLQGQGRYAFVHKTFQEYLTAMEIRDRQEEGFDVVLEHIEEYLHDPHWEEVLLLLIAQQKRKNPVKVLKAILAHDTPYEQWLHRNLLFAGNVLDENVPVADSDLVSSILSQLMGLEVTRSPLVTQTLRHRIFSIFSGLYETVFEHTALEWLESHKDDLNRWRFLEYQGVLAPNKTASALISLLQDADSDVRSRAAMELINLDQGSDEVLNGLLALLQNDDPDVRSYAAVALVELGQGSDEVLNGLLALLQNDDPDICYRAAVALGNLDQGSNEVVNGLLALLQNDDSDVRSRAAIALGNLGQGSDEVVNGLLALLQNDDSDVRSRAAIALGNLGQGSDEVVNGLLALLQNDDSDVRSRAAIALGNLGQGSDEVVNGLLALLKDNDSDVRSYAAMTLVELDQGSDEVLNGLLALLKDADSDVRSRAAIALGNLDQGSDEVLNGLLALLKDADSDVRSRAAIALVELGQGSDEVLNGLLALLKNADSDVRSRAAMALVELGQGSDEVVNGLLALLQNDDPDVRSRAAIALGNLGQGSDEVVNGLLALLKDNDSDVRSYAAMTLVELGQGSDEVLNGLLALLQNDDSDVRSYSTGTLGNIGQKFSGLIFSKQVNFYFKHYPLSLYSRVSYQAVESLITLGKRSNKVELVLVHWIEQHQEKDFVGNGVDVLWELVS
ncbi:MAG: hypothetical protein F6K19_05995 [Cyanothece sp. SIO1E1]|nr:hypothetical protein [Cyanothece sp. SIO1E1]